MIITNKPYYIEIYSYTLNEIMSEYLELNYFNLDEAETIIDELSGGKYDLNEILTNYNDNASFVNELVNLLLTRYKDYIIFESDKVLDSNEKLVEIDNFLIKLISILKMTYSRYTMLLTLYKNNESKLLDAIKSSSELDSRFNDTPQNEGTYEEATHNTNVSQSKSVTTNERDTLIERLNDISNKYRNLLKEWCNEFTGIFIERSI